MLKRTWILLVLLLLVATACTGARAEKPSAGPMRLGYFPNLTHAQALLGLEDGTFEKRIGMPVVAKGFTAGPSAITALLAGEIDATYVGPSPAVNGYVRSDGKALKIVAGGASGGAVLVVRPGTDLTNLNGRHLGSPGLGNTQDVSLRYWLAQKGYRLKEQGGTVKISPLQSGDLLGLIARGQIDGAWVPEPWGSRMVHEAGAQIALDERDLWAGGKFATTVLVIAAKYLREHRAEATKLVAAHVEITRWMQAHPAQAEKRLQAALAKVQGSALSDDVMADAFQRVDFVYDPMQQSVQEQANRAYSLGLLGALKAQPDLSGMFDLTLIREVAP